MNEYILNEDHTVTKIGGLNEYFKWMRENPGAYKRQLEIRKIKQEHIGSYFVSTVFLGIDHSFDAESDPILFETMIFFEGKGKGTDDDLDSHLTRCGTYDEALEMHKEAVALVNKKLS